MKTFVVAGTGFFPPRYFGKGQNKGNCIKQNSCCFATHCFMTYKFKKQASKF